MRTNFAIYMDTVIAETKGDTELTQMYRDELEECVSEDLEFIALTPLNRESPSL